MSAKRSRPRIRIDAEHTLDLLEGKAVGIKIPAGADAIELELDPQIVRICRRLDQRFGLRAMTKLADVFFNGRPA